MAFNSAPFHGKLVRVEKNDVAMEYSEGWGINSQLDMADIPRVGQHWKESLPGQAGWDGSFGVQFVAGNTEQKAFLDNLIAATPGTKLTDVKFLLDGATNAITGDIYITNFSMAPGVGDAVRGVFTFRGDGAMALTDAA